MNLVHQLSYFENKISSLKTFQKIELYLMPILLGIFIIYNFEEVDTTQIIKPKRVLEKNRVDFYSFLKEFQEFANEKDVHIAKTKQSENIISLELEGSFHNLLELLYFCETYKSVNIVENLKLEKLNDLAILQFELKFAQHKYDFEKLNLAIFDDKKIDKKVVGNSKEVVKKEKITNLELKAIINNEAFINNIWLKKGDNIGEFVVFKINSNSVILKSKDGKEIILNLWERKK